MNRIVAIVIGAVLLAVIARASTFIVHQRDFAIVFQLGQIVRVVTEPITQANYGMAMHGPEMTEAVHEVTLTEERVVVNKDTVPVERVRLATETVVEQKTVTENVRKEVIETATDVVSNARAGKPKHG